MTDSISITVPMTAKALSGASLMLFNLANDLMGMPEPTIEEAAFAAADDMSGAEIERKIPVSEGGTAPDPAATFGVDLDSEGLPWDVRIHSANKSKLAKTNQWKKKRGVDLKLVVIVEEELRNAMNATPSAPIEPTPTPAAPVAPAAPVTLAPTPEIKYLVDGAEFTEAQLKASGWNDDQIALQEVVNINAPAVTFPELMGKITNAVTSNQIADTDVTAALNAQGLTSLPLLASRPDLIPAVHQALFG